MQVDVGSVDTAKFDDAYFKPTEKKEKKKGEAEFFQVSRVASSGWSIGSDDGQEQQAAGMHSGHTGAAGCGQQAAAAARRSIRQHDARRHSCIAAGSHAICSYMSPSAVAQPLAACSAAAHSNLHAASTQG